MEIERKTLPAQPYLYVDCDCAIEGPAIAEAMGQGYARISDFLKQAGITPVSMPMSVYTEMPKDRMRFRCGFMVKPEDAARAEGEVAADELPAGDAMTLTHVGPYASLNQSHGKLWNHMKEGGIEAAMPVWEIFVDDPGKTPEAELRTEIFRPVASG